MQQEKYLTFALGNEIYGMEIGYVVEITVIQQISELPELPEYLKGLINLRGEIVPVMDVRLKLNRAFKEYNDRTCIIVAEIKGSLVGMIVDTVMEVTKIPKDNITPYSLVKKQDDHYVKAIAKVDKGVMLLLDCERFLTVQERECCEKREIAM